MVTYKLTVTLTIEICPSLKFGKLLNFAKAYLVQELSLKQYNLNLAHTGWWSHEQLNIVETLINFKLSKASLIQELLCNKVTQWVLKCYFSIFWRGQIPKCSLSVPVTVPHVNASKLSHSHIFCTLFIYQG